MRILLILGNRNSPIGASRLETSKKWQIPNLQAGMSKKDIFCNNLEPCLINILPKILYLRGEHAVMEREKVTSCFLLCSSLWLAFVLALSFGLPKSCFRTPRAFPSQTIGRRYRRWGFLFWDTDSNPEATPPLLKSKRYLFPNWKHDFFFFLYDLSDLWLARVAEGWIHFRATSLWAIERAWAAPYRNETAWHWRKHKKVTRKRTYFYKTYFYIKDIFILKIGALHRCWSCW